MSKFKGKFKEWALATGLVDHQFFKQKIRVSKDAIKRPSKKIPASLNSPESEGKLEKEIQAELEAYLDTLPLYWMKMHTKGELHTVKDKAFFKANAYAGRADYLIHYCGNTFWLETKRNNEYQSGHQITFEETVKKHGIDYIIVTNWKQVRDYLQQKFGIG